MTAPKAYGGGVGAISACHAARNRLAKKATKLLDSSLEKGVGRTVASRGDGNRPGRERGLAAEDFPGDSRRG